ncbi:MAG: hypothetical protein KDB23_06065, partial [Planctomycetales bacterium]|nr:hypothetical protein [Planctomycetales bacterium]
SALSSRPGSYSAQFRSQVSDAAVQLRNAARQLSSLTVAGDRSNRTRDAATRVIQRWNALDPKLGQFTAADRDHLLIVRQQIVPAIVELQSFWSMP